MHHATPLITTIVGGLVLAFILGMIANKLRISPLVGYLLAGVLAGPFTPGFVADTKLAPELAELGVILLMFGVGLHFSLKDLMAVKSIAIPGAIAQIAVATLLGMALSAVLGWSLMVGIVFGLCLSTASTVVLLRALEERQLIDSQRGQIAIGWLIVEDLMMVLTLVLLPAVAGMLEKEDVGFASLAVDMGITIGKVVAFIAIMMLVGRRLVPWIMARSAATGSRELFTLSVLALALGIAFGAVELFDVSFALGAFFAGMVLNESELSHRAAHDTLPLRDAFAVLFFVSVGMLFDPLVLIQQPLAVLGTLAIIIFGKSLAAYFLVRLFGHSQRTALTIATSLAQIGEFAFILAGLGMALNLLPQADEHDRAVFLSRYFGLENKDYVKRFLQMNRGITILEDYSAGSNATTMLCMDTQSTFYRKYAFGKDGAKLAEQLDWLRAQQDRLPLCDILRSEEADGCCWYDMVYNPQAVGMFRYLHSNPVEKSRAILRAVLATLEDKLYKPTAVPADAEKIEKYIETKVDGNLKKLHEDRMLRELMSYDTLRINGVEYKNLPALDWMFDHDRLRNLFAKDPVGTIHGDLTIENIICRTDNDSWYLIDPNTGNLHESPFLDYGKLLQSLHGSYEFMMKTPRVAVQDNRIDFQLTRSAAYDALLAAVMEDLSARYPREQVESILMHEVIHWLRLMPYKLNKDRKRAAMFYAGLVMVANDVADFSEHKKETLC